MEKYITAIEVRLFYIALQNIKTVSVRTSSSFAADNLLEAGMWNFVGKQAIDGQYIVHFMTYCLYFNSYKQSDDTKF